MLYLCQSWTIFIGTWKHGIAYQIVPPSLTRSCEPFLRASTGRTILLAMRRDTLAHVPFRSDAVLKFVLNKRGVSLMKKLRAVALQRSGLNWVSATIMSFAFASLFFIFVSMLT